MREEVWFLIEAIDKLEYLLSLRDNDLKYSEEYKKLIQEKNNFVKRYGGLK